MRNVRCNERICSNRKSMAVEVVFRFRGEGEGHEVSSPVKAGSSAKIKTRVGLLAGSVSLRGPKKQHN